MRSCDLHSSLLCFCPVLKCRTASYSVSLVKGQKSASWQWCICANNCMSAASAPMHFHMRGLAGGNPVLLACVCHDRACILQSGTGGASQRVRAEITHFSQSRLPVHCSLLCETAQSSCMRKFRSFTSQCQKSRTFHRAECRNLAASACMMA